MFFFAEKVFIDPLIPQPLVYFPHMCSMNTEAMNIKLMTRTGTGPLKLQSFHSLDLYRQVKVLFCKYNFKHTLYMTNM